MLSNDATIQNIKHEILYEVAKLAYAGRFEEEKARRLLRLNDADRPAL